jgi:hypothetical protein
MDEYYWCEECDECDDCGGGFYGDIDPEIEPECPCCGSTLVAP